METTKPFLCAKCAPAGRVCTCERAETLELVIQQGGVKRIVRGDFSICLNKATARILREACEDFEKGDAVYGWTDVRERLPLAANTPPREWHE